MLPSHKVKLLINQNPLLSLHFGASRRVQFPTHFSSITIFITLRSKSTALACGAVRMSVFFWFLPQTCFTAISLSSCHSRSFHNPLFLSISLFGLMCTQIQYPRVIINSLLQEIPYNTTHYIDAFEYLNCQFYISTREVLSILLLQARGISKTLT